MSHAHREALGDLIDAEQLLELFQMKPTVKSGAKTLSLQEGRVTFKNVKFGYDGKKQIINDLSFEAAPGQTVALIGETGGGKSTILKLIFRFYDITGGAILVDGQDIRDVTLESLRECIGVVPQDPTLFNKTILSNVQYAKLDATDDEIKDACRSAAVHDKIMTFTDKYSSKVGEQGVRLSGGELQRIAIARAILKDPKIILLDEATSSVDSETESRIQEALAKLSKGRTTFVVAHRLSTIMDADLILVIKDGKIVEHGQPADLLRSKGRYYTLWCKQMGIHTETPVSEDRLAPDGIDGQDDSAQQGNLDSCHVKGLVLEGNIPKRDGSENSRPSLSQSPSKGKLGNISSATIFRPNAPEFLPTNHNTNGNGPDDHNELLHGNAAKKYQLAENRRKPRTKKGKVKKDIKLSPKDQIDGASKDSPCHDISREADHVQSIGSKDLRPITKTSRFDRRRQSRSEPADQSGHINKSERASESIMRPTKLNETGSMGSKSRRASAPSDPPAGPSKLPRSANWPRRRVRHSQWRARTQNESATSENLRTEPSREFSTDSSLLTNPTGPFPSPATGFNTPIISPGMLSASNVRSVHSP